MSEPKTYVVTARAGRRVAGHVVREGQELTLADAAAEHHLREGEIVVKGSELDKAFGQESETSKRLIAEARAFRERAASAQAAKELVAAAPAAPEAPVSGGAAAPAETSVKSGRKG